MGAAVSAVGSLISAGSDITAADTKAKFTAAQMQEQVNETQVSANVELGQASAANYNANIAGDQATLALQTAAQEEAAYKVQAAQELGTIRTSYAANGVGMSGSALDVLASSAGNAELNALTIKHAGDISANSYTNTENLDKFQAAQATYQAQAAEANASYQASLIAPTTEAIQTAGEEQAAGVLLGAGGKAISSMPSNSPGAEGFLGLGGIGGAPL